MILPCRVAERVHQVSFAEVETQNTNSPSQGISSILAPSGNMGGGGGAQPLPGSFGTGLI